MLFNSLHFVLFLPFVVATYFLMPFKYRWAFLLGASYYFYMCWKPEYVLLLLFSTLIDYYAALQIGKSDNASKRKFFLGLSLSLNLGTLFLFKYFNFLNASARAAFDHFNLFYNVPMFELLLPVGISFYTFQTMSYVIDVYRGEQKAETHLGRFALYVTFFPQLVAGPIERSTTLMPQFHERHNFEWPRVLDGLKIMLWGFFKKIVIADRLAGYVNPIYNDPTSADGINLLLATYFFAFQIYCDFSGYSDIAVGTAKVLGYRLMSNFERPYLSQSIAEFWKRWHISLSTWFKDYLYIPLGGNRVAKWRWCFNLFTVFLVSGLWHGANWTFVIWGALHGLYLVFAILTSGAREKLVHGLALDRVPTLLRASRTVITFHLVLFAWIFFRANHMSDALLIIEKVFHVFSGAALAPITKLITLPDLMFVLALLVFMNFYERFQIAWRTLWQSRLAAITLASVLFWAIVVWGAFDNQQFIYFQF